MLLLAYISPFYPLHRLGRSLSSEEIYYQKKTHLDLSHAIRAKINHKRRKMGVFLIMRSRVFGLRLKFYGHSYILRPYRFWGCGPSVSRWIAKGFGKNGIKSRGMLIRTHIVDGLDSAMTFGGP